MLQLIDGEVARSSAYFVGAGICALAWHIERRSATGPELLPRFWLGTAILLLALGLARSLGVGEAAVEAGRERVHEGGWYESRRPLQATIVLLFGGTWAVASFVALWHFPERRRRYLPAVLVISFLLAFAAVRLVSFHHVDSLLYRTHFVGVRMVSLVELGATGALGLIAGAAVTGSASRSSF